MQFELDTGKGESFQFFRSEQDDDGNVKYFDPDPAEPCRVVLRLADPDVLEGIYKQTRTKVVERVLNPKSKAMERLKDFDQTDEQVKLERQLIWDHAIVSWEGVLDAKGVVVECTTENKMKMMNIPLFARFISRCLSLISGEAVGKKEVLKKNS